MAAILDPDLAKTGPAATGLYDGDRHLLTVMTNAASTGITLTQTGIEQATTLIADPMATH